MSDHAPAEITLPPPKPKRPAKKPRNAWFPLKVDPTEPLLTAETPWYVAAWLWLRAGWKGIAVSVVVHTAILVVLGLIVIRQTGGNKGDVLYDGAFYIPDPAGSPTGAKNVGPIRIDAVKDPLGAPPPEGTKPAEAGAKPGRGPGPPVKAVAVGGMLGGRGSGAGGGGSRAGAVGKAGGDERVERAITSGLAWLARQQQPGGNWKLHEGYPDPGRSTRRTDTGATGLALMCFLGAGHTHVGGGPHQSIVRKGLEWLKSAQKPDGDYHDHEELGRETAYYAHSFALIAMCEALALTNDDELRESARKGVKYLLDSQQPHDGGWKFRSQNQDTVADLAVTGWALTALHTARSAGLGVPDDSYQRGSGFLDRVQTKDGTRYRFEPSYPDDRFTLGMTAEGIFSRQYLGWPKDHPEMQDALAWLVEADNLPVWAEGRRNVDAWLFTAEALHNVGGSEWIAWYGRVAKVICEAQNKSGAAKGGGDVRGSWNPKPEGDPLDMTDRWGRLYLTAMCLLTLETPFRHAPVYGAE